MFSFHSINFTYANDHVEHDNIKGNLVSYE